MAIFSPPFSLLPSQHGVSTYVRSFLNSFGADMHVRRVNPVINFACLTCLGPAASICIECFKRKSVEGLCKGSKTLLQGACLAGLCGEIGVKSSQ